MAEVFQKEVEVYFPSATLHGILTTRHARLTDHLATADDTFLLKAVKLKEEYSKHGNVSSDTVVVYKHRVVLVADLGPNGRSVAGGAQLLRVDRQPHRVIIGAGPFWLRGNVHLVKGADLETVGLGNIRFIPLTQAVLIDRPIADPTTFVINREQIGCLFIEPNESGQVKASF